MAKLMFIRQVASMEKTAKLETNGKTVFLVGTLLLIFLGAAIFLYTKNQPDAGRLVIDLAIGFFGWATGRALGERAGATAEH